MPRPETPALTADTIIQLLDYPGHSIVLIERKNPPFGWAIPGGFVDVGEALECAAVREAKEEVCLDVELTALLGLYSQPQRDPRGHTVTAVYAAQAHGQPQAADDAKSVKVFQLDDLPDELAFDHRLILEDYLNYCHSGKLTPLRF